MYYLHDLAAPSAKLVDAIGSRAIGVLLDYANMVLFPDNPSPTKVVEMLGGRIFQVHLKNIVALPGCGAGAHLRVGLADGEVNNRELLRCLQQIGYNGPLCIEAPRSGDREWFAQQDLAYLKSLLKDLDW
jgi:sugar phosphate isomerase/epimerase